MPKIFMPQETFTSNANQALPSQSTVFSTLNQRIDLGSALEQIGNNLVQDSFAYLERTQAINRQANVARKLNEAKGQIRRAYKDRANQTHDDKGNPTYQTLVKDVRDQGRKIKQEAIKGEKDPITIKWVRAGIEQAIINSIDDASGEFKKQQLREANDTLHRSINTILLESIEDPFDGFNERTDELKLLLDGAVESGLLLPSKAEKLYNSSVSSMQFNRFREMAKDSPDDVSEAMKRGLFQNLTPEMRSALIKESAAIKKDLKAQSKEEQALAEKKLKEFNNINTADIETAILTDQNVSTNDIIKARHDGLISPQQQVDLLKALDSRNKKKNEKLDRLRNIESSLNDGTIFTADPKHVEESYVEALKAVKDYDQTEQLDLPRKAQIAARYKQPIKSFTNELTYSLKFSDPSRMTNALKAYEYLRENSPAALSDLDSDTRLIAEMASNWKELGEVTPQNALKQARDAILNVREEDKKAAIREFNTLDAFKVEDIEKTVRGALGMSGKKKLDPIVVNKVRTAIRDNYRLTRNAALSITTAGRQISALVGETELGQEKGLFNDRERIMYYPPKMLGIEGTELQTQLFNDLTELEPGLKELDITSDNIGIRSTPESRNEFGVITYQVFIELDDGSIHFVTDPKTGLPLEYAPPVNKILKNRSKAKLDKALKKQQRLKELHD